MGRAQPTPATLPGLQVRKLRLVSKKTPNQVSSGVDSGPVFNIHLFICAFIHSFIDQIFLECQAFPWVLGYESERKNKRPGPCSIEQRSPAFWAPMRT